MAESSFNGVKFTDADVVNPDDFSIHAGCGNNKPFLLHDHGFCVAVVFAECEQDALDIAADAGSLDSYSVADCHLAEYGPEEEGIIRLGNASVSFDIQALDIVQLPNPPFSFAALFNAHNP